MVLGRPLPLVTAHILVDSPPTSVTNTAPWSASTSAVIRVAFVRLHPEALRSFQKVQEVTPLCPEPSHRPVRATQPYAPPHPSAPAPAFVSLMVLSALVFVTLLHVFSRRRQAP